MVLIYHRHAFRKDQTPSNVRTDLGNMKKISHIQSASPLHSMLEGNTQTGTPTF